MKTRRDADAGSLVRRIVESSIEAVRPATLFERSFMVKGGEVDVFGNRFELSAQANVRCVAVGKSAEAMAFEIRHRLGERVTGLIATPLEKHFDVKGFDFRRTGHPYPDNESSRAGMAALDFVKRSGQGDLLLFLISGGGSASIFVPVEGVSLSDANQTMKILFDEGVPIDRVNLVRRHLSLTAGGKLSALAPGCRKVSLIISDVVGDDLSAIASGPTVPDETSPADAVSFLEESGLIGQIPAAVPAALRRKRDFRPETENLRDAAKIIASNREALLAAEKTGLRNGFNTVVLSRHWQSDSAEAASAMVSIARSVESDGFPVCSPALILLGGETTVKVRGNGRGGRNQQMVLHTLVELAKLQQSGTALLNTTLFSFGTDGKDGNSDAAGAHVSLGTLADVGGGLSEIEEYVERNDSSSFFEKYGGLITTGPTDTNVMDIFGVVVV